MLQDQAKLVLVALELVVAQTETGKTGDMGNINLNRHSPESVGKRVRYPSGLSERVQIPVSSTRICTRLAGYRANVTTTNGLRSTAFTLGVIGMASISIGVGIAIFGGQGLSEPSAGILIRVGAVLGATALILPSLRRPSFPTIAIISVGTILVLARPGLIWVGLIGWVAWLIAGRQSKRADSDS